MPIKKQGCREEFFNIGEMKESEDGRKYFPVTIIQEGLGNLKDRNFYTESAIRSAPSVYEGKPAYYNHPDAMEERLNPNRSIKDMIGHYEDVKAVQGKSGLFEAQGKLFPISGDSRKDAIEMLEHAVAYKKKYPDKDFVGVSINGDGEGETMAYDEGMKKYAPKAPSIEKLKQIEGQDVNWITKLSDAFSADIVTLAGAGGKINTTESKERRRMKFKEAMRKILSALEKKDYKAAEAAANTMLQSEAKDKDKEDSTAEGKEDSAVKKMLQAMKDAGGKKEGEADEEYEGRLKAALMKQDEKKENEDEDEKKEGEDKDAKDDKKDSDDKSDDDKKESEDEDEKKESEDDDGDDDDGKDDKKGGMAKAMKQMQKQMKQMQSDMEEMKKEKKESEEAVKDAKKEAAAAKTTLSVKSRNEMIDRKLAESGKRREVTKLWRGVLERCRTEKEMDEAVKDLVETYEQACRERFFMSDTVGTTEKSGDDKTSNLDLFK